MRRTLYRLMIELTNGRFTSYILRKFAQSRLSSIIIPSYAKVFQINQDEMEKGLKEYRTLHELFTRKLKEGKRSIDTDASSIVSPVDGVLQIKVLLRIQKHLILKESVIRLWIC